MGVQGIGFQVSFSEFGQEEFQRVLEIMVPFSKDPYRTMPQNPGKKCKRPLSGLLLRDLNQVTLHLGQLK